MHSITRAYFLSAFLRRLAYRFVPLLLVPAILLVMLVGALFLLAILVPIVYVVWSIFHV